MRPDTPTKTRATGRAGGMVGMFEFSCDEILLAKELGFSVKLVHLLDPFVRII